MEPGGVPGMINLQHSVFYVFIGLFVELHPLFCAAFFVFVNYINIF